jgi:hypothetical protein
MALTLTTLHCLQEPDTSEFYTSSSTRSKQAVIKSDSSTERCAERLILHNFPRTGCLNCRIYTGAKSVSESRRTEKQNTVS